MENQMETGMKEMVKKEENSDRFSTIANAGDRKKTLEKAKRSIDSMFRRSVKVEISPAVVENAKSGQLAKPLNQEPSQLASSCNVMKTEEISDIWSTMAVPEMPVSSSRKSTTRPIKMQETRSSQPSKDMKFMNGALVDASVSAVTSAVPAVPANGFISTSTLNGADKACISSFHVKRPATIVSSPVQVKSNGSTVQKEHAITTATPAENGTHERSIWETEPEDCDDKCCTEDADINETGIAKQRQVEDNTHHAIDECNRGQFTCLDCVAVFQTNAAFKLHIASHKGYRRYKCTVCEKRSITKQNLMVHMRRHTGEQPFECPVCQKRFSLSGNLHKHKVIHTGKKPSKCDVCKKGFMENGSLTKHKRIHTGKKPYKCDVCKKCFTQSGSLKMHKLQGRNPTNVRPVDNVSAITAVLRHTGVRSIQLPMLFLNSMLRRTLWISRLLLMHVIHLVILSMVRRFSTKANRSTLCLRRWPTGIQIYFILSGLRNSLWN